MVLCSTESREIAVQVVEETLGRICEDLHREKLNLLWTCLLEEINGELQRVLQHLDQAGIHSKENRHRIEQETAEAKVSMQENTNGVSVVQHDNSALSEQDWWSHLTNLLYLLNGVLEFRKGSRVHGGLRLSWACSNFPDVVGGGARVIELLVYELGHILLSVCDKHLCKSP
jgi:hypothetical protein